MNLVNKDQLEILNSLRESVNEDKSVLEAELEQQHKYIKELNEKNRMQLEQINGLLLEKVNLQSEGIGQREKMLQRERDFRRAPSIASCFGTDSEYLVICVHPYRARMYLKTSSPVFLIFMRITSYSKSNSKQHKKSWSKHVRYVELLSILPSIGL